MQVTFFQTDGTPLDKGVQIELLDDGNVLLTETADDGGVVSFDVETAGMDKLAVRLVSPQTTPARDE